MILRKPQRPWRCVWCACAGALALVLLRLCSVPLQRVQCWPLLWSYPDDLALPPDFEGFDNVTGVQGGAFIVPAIVHYVRFDRPEFSFIEFVCVLSALRRQRPDRILFHTNVPGGFRGRYWQRLLSTPGFPEVAEVVQMARPAHALGQPFDPQFGPWHSTDVARILILMKHGGIFLDSDVYLAHSLDPLRRFEMSLGWPEGQFLGTQVLLAHRDARFLRLWLESYRGAYVSTQWYYNAGQRPTQLALHVRPELVHRETSRISVAMESLCDLYVRLASGWRSSGMLCVHLFSRLVLQECWWQGFQEGVNVFDLKDLSEESVRSHNVTIRDMVLDVYPELMEG